MTDPDTISADYTLRPSELAETLALLVEARQPAVVWGVKRLSILTPDRRAKLTPLSGTAEVVPVVNRGDPRGFV